MRVRPARAESDINRDLNAYAKHLGIPRRRGSRWESGPLWNGRSLVWLDRAEDTAHEIAHWLIVPDEFRDQECFGWGFDYQWFPENFSLQRTAPDEEVDACMLGFAMLIHLGYPGLVDTYASYSFIENNNGIWELDSDVPSYRRRVQPYVYDFKRWLATRS